MAINWIARVWSSSRATGATYQVLVGLAYHANKSSGEAFPSIGTLAAGVRLSRRTVVSALQDLERLGEIERTGKHRGRTVVYRLTAPDQSAGDALSEAKVQEMHSQSARDALSIEPSGTKTPTSPTTARASLKVIDGGAGQAPPADHVEQKQVFPIPKPTSGKRGGKSGFGHRAPSKPEPLPFGELPGDWERWARHKGHPNVDQAWARFVTWAAESGSEWSDWQRRWRGWITEDLNNLARGETFYADPTRPVTAAERQRAPAARRRWGEGEVLDDDTRLKIRAGAMEAVGGDPDRVRQAYDGSRRRMGLED